MILKFNYDINYDLIMILKFCVFLIKLKVWLVVTKKLEIK